MDRGYVTPPVTVPLWWWWWWWEVVGSRWWCWLLVVMVMCGCGGDWLVILIICIILLVLMTLLCWYMTTYVAAKFCKLKNVTLGNGVGALKYNSFIKNTLWQSSGRLLWMWHYMHCCIRLTCSVLSINSCEVNFSFQCIVVLFKEVTITEMKMFCSDILNAWWHN